MSLALVSGSLAWVMRWRAPAEGQVEVGQRCGLLRVDEDGIQGAGLGAPGDGDLISGGFAEAMQLFGGGGLRGCGDRLSECVGYG